MPARSHNGSRVKRTRRSACADRARPALASPLRAASHVRTFARNPAQVSLFWTKIWRTPYQLDFFTFQTPTSPHAALLLAPIRELQLADESGIGERARGCLTTVLMLKNPRLEAFVAAQTPFCEVRACVRACA